MGRNQEPIHPHSAVAGIWVIKTPQFLLLLGGSTQNIYFTWRLSMIRTALRSKFLLLPYVCWSLQHNKQFNQLSSPRMLQLFA